MTMKPALSREERDQLIETYAAGPERLRRAWQAVPEAARQLPPAAGKWSPHQVVIHCGDSETYGAVRIRMLVAEKAATIVGYDEAEWARVLDYHALPVEPALAAVAAARGNTVALLRQMDEKAWGKAGTHTQSGHFSAQDWLRVYSVHVENHAAQIDRAVDVFKEKGAGG
jgi:hypothetical protein